MENEIINNEEVLETTEEIVAENSNKGLVAVAAIGATLIVGTLVYKKIVKPLIAKHKAKKEQEAEDDRYELSGDEYEEND